MYLFDLIGQIDISGAVGPVVTQEESVEKSSKRNLSCSICPDSSFNILSEYREHYKSRWHQVNLMRVQGNQPAICLLAAEDCDVENVSSSSEDDDKQLQGENTHGPYIQVETLSGYKFLIYKRLVYSDMELNRRMHLSGNLCHPKIIHSRLLDLREAPIVILLIRSGRFAGAVFAPGVSIPVLSKTLKKYTVRRGQGGSQGSQDNKRNSNAKSAGANLRRHNERLFEEEVLSVLACDDWKGAIESSAIVFCLRTPIASAIFRQMSPPINEEKLRSIPITTTRPSIEEVQRVYGTLTSVHLSQLDTLAGVP